jgi:hypothetical protein
MSGMWELLVFAQTVWFKFAVCLVMLARGQDHARSSSRIDTKFRVFVSCSHQVYPDNVYI